jgi:tetratricopeptide (TPR) repeat protein
LNPGRRTTLALLAAATLACAREGPEPSAVLITLDTTRADALGVYGGEGARTPNLDRLAERSVRYTRARTVAPLTLPAHASMLTGLYPPRHTARGNAPSVLPPEATTVAERARAAGFETAGFVASLALDRSLGIAQGFEVWSQPTGAPERSARSVVAEALHWLETRDGSRPYFLWVHLFDPHAPYEPPPGFRDERTPYHGEVAAMDAAVGQLLAALPADAFVAVVGDHGEGLGDHGERTHGLLCFETTMRVPFLVRHRDGSRAGEQSDEVVSVVDVAPTLLRAMELTPEPALDGFDLHAGRARADRGVYFEAYDGWRRFGWSPLAGWADAEGKLVRGARVEWYPGADPDERAAHAGEVPARYERALAELAARPALETSEYRAVADEILDEMARLGYGAGRDSPPAYPDPLAETGRPDARDRYVDYADFQRARDLVEAGDPDTALPILNRLCATNPWDATSRDWLAAAHMARGEHEDAVRVLRERLVLPPEQAETHRDLMLCFEALGDVAAQRHHERRALELIAQAHERHGEHQEAALARKQLERME